MAEKQKRVKHEKRIILPGDAGWDKPRADEVNPPATKLPDEVLEAAFSEVVSELKAAKEKDATEDKTNDPNSVQFDNETKASSEIQKALPNTKSSNPITYKYHKPASKRSYDISAPQAIVVTLLEDLPRAWERNCYTKFRKGDSITITGMTLFPGVGNLYTFAEGSRGSYGVRQDQIQFPEPILKPNEVHPNDALAGQDTQIQ
jgi:hypothetical protein